MSTVASPNRMTYAEYVAAETHAETRHEYLRGEVFAMAGGTPEHGALAIAVAALLVDGLREKPCRVFSSDVRIRVEETDLTTYPDLSIVCGELKNSANDRDAIINPILLVEVLSDSTEAYDRGEKAAHYRRIPSLKEYLFISQNHPRLELFRRTPTDSWELLEAQNGKSIELKSVGVWLKTDDVFHNPLK